MCLKTHHPILGSIFFLTLPFLGAITACGTGVRDVNSDNQLLAAVDDYFTAVRFKPSISPNVLINDKTTLYEFSSLQLTNFTQPARGSVVYNHDGTFTFNPDPVSSIDSDSFTYTVQDTHGTVKSATVFVTMKQSWDTPQVIGANAKHFSFSNGDVLWLWSQSAGLPAWVPQEAAAQHVWAQTYRANVGWEAPTLMLRNVLDTWQATQIANTQGVILVAQQFSSVDSLGNNYSGKIVARRFNENTGWSPSEKVSQQAVDLPTPLTIVASASRATVIWQLSQVLDSTYQPPLLRSELYASANANTAIPDQWGQTVKIDPITNATEASAPYILKTFTYDSGKTVILLTGERGRASSLWVNELPAGSDNWSGPIPLPQLDTAPYTFVDADMDDSGNINLIWRDTKEFLSNRITWLNGSLILGQTRQLSTYSSLYGVPKFARDDNGDFVMAWYSGDVLAVSCNSEGACSNVQKLNVPRIATDGLFFLQSVAPNKKNGIMVLWSQEYYVDNINPITTPSLKEYYPKGIKLFGVQFTNGIRDGVESVQLLDTNNVAVSASPNASSGFVSLVQPTTHELLLLTTRPSQDATGYELYSQTMSQWNGDNSLPPIERLSSTISLTPHVALTQLKDKSGKTTFFWHQDAPIGGAIYSMKQLGEGGGWDSGGAYQLFDYSTSSFDPASFSAAIDSKDRILAAWVYKQEFQQHLDFHLRVDGRWSAVPEPIVDSSIIGVLNKISIENLFIAGGDTPVLMFSSQNYMPSSGETENTHYVTGYR